MTCAPGVRDNDSVMAIGFEYICFCPFIGANTHSKRIQLQVFMHSHCVNQLRRYDRWLDDVLSNYNFHPINHILPSVKGWSYYQHYVRQN